MRDSVLGGTDAGLATIGARFNFAAGLGVGEGAAGVGDALNGPRPRPVPIVRQVPIFMAVPLTAGAGTLYGTIGAAGPPMGWCWSIRRLTAQGYTAGSVVVYENSPNGEAFMPFSQAGAQTGGKGEFLLQPQSYMVVVASGITGTVTLFGRADAFPWWYLTEYIG
jgi:hypothetical protein